MFWCLIFGTSKVFSFGVGNPVFFSSGLYGSMPHTMYSDILNELKKDLKIIVSGNFQPLLKHDLDVFCDENNIENFDFISHSSFDHTILSSPRLKNAILFDPVSFPDSMKNRNINVQKNTTIVKSYYAYESKYPFILPLFAPNINGSCLNTIITSSGHVDLLDERWANIGKNVGIYSMIDSEETMSRTLYKKHLTALIKNIIIHK